MVRDYAKNRTHKRSIFKKRKRRTYRKKRSSGFWLFFGLMLGLLIAGLFYLKFHNKNVPPVTASQSKAQVQQSNKPKFDFYTLLPKMQVWVPKHARTSQKSQQSKTECYLQVASLERFKDADKKKVELILRGYNVSIKPIDDTGKTWYRVWVGPYSTVKAAKNAKAKLAREKVKSIILKFEL